MEEPTRQQTPRLSNPAARRDSSSAKQSELKLNVGIGIIGTILSVGVTIIFLFVLDELVLGIVFAVVALVSLGITIYVNNRRKQAQQQS